MPWKDQCHHAHLHFLWFERRRSRRQAISMADLSQAALALLRWRQALLGMSGAFIDHVTVDIGQLCGLHEPDVLVTLGVTASCVAD